MKSIRKKLRHYFGGGAILILVFMFVGQAAAQTWIELFPTGGPPNERNSHSAVYDSATNRMIVFGGVPYHEAGAPPLYNDVWVLSNADGTEASTPTWTQLSPPGGGPLPRGVHSAVYDPTTNRMIVFGGDPSIGSCNNRTNDVWVLENANGMEGTPNWIQLTPSGGPPSPRGLHSAVYDPTTNRMIVFGGNNACEPANNDVWVLENANGMEGTPNWIQLTPSGAVPVTIPGSSSAHSAVYDQANNRMIVFVGIWCCANDVYVLENANGLGGAPNWIQLTPSGTRPGERGGQTAVYNPSINQMILFGGYVGATGMANDTWLLLNANGLGETPEWIQLSPAGALPAIRDAHTAIENPATDRMTVFGGRTDGSGLNDIWVLNMAPSNQPPVANAGPDQIVILGEEVTFDGSGSSDPDGTITSYEWDFDDGNIGSGKTTIHLYASAGTYVVILTVTDDDGAKDTDSLTVTVQSPAEATQDLISDVEDLELPGGLENSLVSKLESAIQSMDKGQDNAAINKLNAFINQVEAQRGKKITDEDADQLIATAQSIIDNI